MSGTLSSASQRIQDLLESLGFDYTVIELPDTTRTAIDAANSVGCTVGQIAKSLIFRGKRTGKPILIIASGSNRVNEKRIAEYIGEPIEKADAEFVRTATGFAIGGVPPLGHLQDIRTFIDEDLLQHERIWAAGGTPNSVFQLEAKDLQDMTSGEVAPI
ncbi:MAG TPA: YbaK/EbsC family protein [Firmicutes bacterium]|nr:YbaK/EbsC family protein [Bacillota bacterium]